MTWPYDLQSGTPEKYRFKLISETDTIICDIPPMEWAAGTLEMKRDLDCGGVFSSYVCDSLTFVGNSATFLKNLFASKSVNAQCTLVVSYWKGFDVVATNARQYVEFPTQYQINFCFYEIVKVGRFFFGVRVKAINSSVQTKLDNRQDVEVNLTGLTSIGSTEANITDYSSLKKKVYFAATTVNFSAALNKSGIYALNHSKSYNSYTCLPLDKGVSELTEVQSVNYLTVVSGLGSIPSFFTKALIAYTLDIDYEFLFACAINYTSSSSQPFDAEIIVFNSSIGIVSTHVIGSFGKTLGMINYKDTVQIQVNAGEELKLVVQAAGFNHTYMSYAHIMKLNISVAVSSTPEATIEGFPVYEALERTCQHVLDTQYPIYSDFFGRMDVSYRDGIKYSSEDQRRFAQIHGGLNIRGAKLYDPITGEGNSDVQLALSFKNLFKSLKALYNIGYAIETLDGETSQRIRIEEYVYFFEDALGLDLSDRITKYDIQSQVMPELIPVDLKSGYDNFEYLSVNGLGEPNTVNQRTSIMNTATKWENISPIRGDTKGIIDNLANPLGENGTTDTKGDNAVFIIKTQKPTVPVNNEDWIPEKDTNIRIDSGSLFKDELLNRYFTPTRMMIRHINRIAAGMTLFPLSKLTFQKTDKWSSLMTSGEGVDYLSESDDILTSSLFAPLYKAMKHTAIVDFTFADLEVLKLYPYRYIKFSADISGYLLSFKKKNNEDKAEITIIERNIILS